MIGELPGSRSIGPLPLAALGRFTSAWRGQESDRSGRMVDAAMTVSPLLLGWIRLAQQHRGLSSAWLSGNAGFVSVIMEKRREITCLQPQILAALVARSVALDSVLPRVEGDQLFQRWEQLVHGLESKSVEQSLVLHTFLIGDVCGWLERLGSECVLPVLNDEYQRRTARNYFQHLPELSECLGQARAIGSAVATREGCSPMERVRLVRLVAHAEALMERLRQGDANSEAGRIAIRCAGELFSEIRSRMLMRTGVRVTAQAYFQLATQAIDAVFEWIDTCGGQLSLALGPAGER
ncbi:MAG: nitrate- and nitrite sensing domain-containing protein [Zoogloeaceae bacterium]|nr:nitrate- and nitrite sensing domain-containing protein [Zoogloeaceae bacterium]